MMKHHFLSSLILVFLVLRVDAAPKPTGRITLEDAKKYAISNNFEISALREALKASEAKRAQAQAPFYPTLGVKGGLDYENTKLGGQSIGVGLIYADYNLFRGFGDRYRLSAANRAVDISRIRLKKAEFRVGTEVEASFHLYLFRKTAVLIQEKALTLNKTHQSMARKRRKSGLVTQSDVMEFDIEESLLNSQLVSMQQQLEIARIDLKKLLGREIGNNIEPVGSLQHQHLEGSLMEYLNRIQSENEEILTRTKAVEKAEFEKKASTSVFFPEINLEARVGYENIHDRPQSGGAIFGGMIFAKFDLFSGFSTVSARREKVATLLKQEARLKQAILNAVTESERTYRTIKSIQTRVDLEEKNEERARKFYRSVLGEYKRGVKNSSDVKSASELYIKSILRREQFKYDFLVERLKLERLIGGPTKITIVAEMRK